jgi:hypothetical protein
MKPCLGGWGHGDILSCMIWAACRTPQVPRYAGRACPASTTCRGQPGCALARVWPCLALSSLNSFAGYANEVGESFRHVAPRLVAPSYVVAFGYVFADTVDKTWKAHKTGTDGKGLALAAGDTLLWQTAASVLMPGLTINRIVHFSSLLAKSQLKSSPGLQVCPRRALRRCCCLLAAIAAAYCLLLLAAACCGVHTLLLPACLPRTRMRPVCAWWCGAATFVPCTHAAMGPGSPGPPLHPVHCSPHRRLRGQHDEPHVPQVDRLHSPARPSVLHGPGGGHDRKGGGPAAGQLGVRLAAPDRGPTRQRGSGHCTHEGCRGGGAGGACKSASCCCCCCTGRRKAMTSSNEQGDPL